MFEVIFDKVTVSKPNRYVLLLKAQQETKRTDISPQWTSNPTFSPLPLSQLTPIELKLCEATLDRKIKVVGTATVSQQEMTEDGEGYEGEVQLKQEIQGKMVCVGLLHLRIVRKKQFEAVPESITRQLKTEVSEQYEFELDTEELEQENRESAEEDEDAVRIQVHCGLNFYLGSQFYIQATWGRSSFRTRTIKDKISPVWAEGGRVTGRAERPISLQIKDTKGNILQCFKFSLPNLRILFPYHIRLVFREDYCGAIPELYFSLIRESPARHSITQRPLIFGVRNFGQPTHNSMYLMLSLNKNLHVPLFTTLDCSQSASLQQVNTFLAQRTGGEEDWVDLIGLSNSSVSKSLSIFKSYLTRKLHMSLLSISDVRAWFSGSKWEGGRTIDSRTDFETVLKKVYYHGETFTLKKILQFFNPEKLQEQGGRERSGAEQWKLLTKNYILRNQMVSQSIRHIKELQQAIQDKGAQLISTKKILGKVKALNFQLVARQKLMSAIRGRSRPADKVLAKQIDGGALISALYQKQSILQGQKRINAELVLRMESLSEVQEHQQDLGKEVLANAQKLLEQQQRISTMKSMEEAIRQQRILIGQLERRFEKGQMDKRVNEALQKQRLQLDHVRERKQQDLKKVYQIIKNNNQRGGGLHAKIKQAEETLIKLNEQYARLTGL